jgi:DDE superfamily endonuclease
MPPGQGGRGRFPPLQRVEIERWACWEPLGVGLGMTHGATRSLARVAVERGIVPHIAPSTVALLLRHADLQPHRSRYWKTPTLDAEFRHRAARAVWCYEQADELAERNEGVICLDEKPHLQAPERRCAPTPRRPGQIERRAFEYIRHGTVSLLVALVVHTGQMRGWCLDRNGGGHLCQALPQLFHQHRRKRRIHLIWDGGPSHTAGDTHDLVRAYHPQVRLLSTPAHAAWLNQAELLLRAVAARYLHRGQWQSRQHLIAHLEASWPGYNQLFAHPFTWSWTRRHMHQWMDRHLQCLCSKTYRTVH